MTHILLFQQPNIALTGEQLIGIDRPCGEACLAVGILSLLTHNCAGRIGHDTGRAELVFQNIVERVVDSHRTFGGVYVTIRVTVLVEVLSTS